jgi:hypothetical protein
MIDYTAISAEKKAPALALLREATVPVTADARLHGTPVNAEWWKTHKLIGMALCNLLRSRGYGEVYFGVPNLDDIYVSLIEEACAPEPTGYDPASISVLQ